MSDYPPPQGPAYDPNAAQPQYGAPQYGAPQYGAQPQYGAPQYGAQPQYGAPPGWSPQNQSPYPGSQPYGVPPRRSRTPIVIASVIGGLVVLAVAAALVYIFAFRGSNSSRASDEDQIRALINESQDAYNRADATAFANELCHSNNSIHQQTSDEMRQSLNDDGQVTLSVDNIVVTGDHATGVVTERYSKSTEMNRKSNFSFVREGGDWKLCGSVDNDTGTPVPPTP